MISAFFSSASSTALLDERRRNFTAEDGDIRGHLVSDVLRLGDDDGFRVRIGVADVVTSDALLASYFRADAIIGIARPDTNAAAAEDDDAPPTTSILAQLLDAFQRPVITTYVNR